MANSTDSYTIAQKKHREAEDRIASIGNTIVILSIVLAIFAGSLAKQFFSYEVDEEVTKRESYQHPVGTVNTYVCYITDYGACYHARGCSSLWKSSHKTTVYAAKKAGYQPCSKCTPTVRTTLVLTETRYRDVTKTKTVTKEPAFLVWLCGTGCLVVAYFALTVEWRKQRDEASAEMQRIKEENDRLQRAQAAMAARRKEEERQNNNMNVLHSLGAGTVVLPQGVTLLPDGTPVSGQVSRFHPYGSYTVFISPSGRKFHKHIRCYRNLTAIHLFKLPPGYTPCKNCASGMQYPVIRPAWYMELTVKKRF